MNQTDLELENEAMTCRSGDLQLIPTYIASYGIIPVICHRNVQRKEKARRRERSAKLSSHSSTIFDLIHINYLFYELCAENQKVLKK